LAQYAGGTGGDALCRALHTGAVEVGLCLLDVLDVLDVSEGHALRWSVC
jgi:hypothetical protein